MSSEKRALIVKGSTDVLDSEVASAVAVGDLCGFQCNVVDLSPNVASQLPSQCFSMLYVAGYSDKVHFGEKTGTNPTPWTGFISALCESSCLLPGTTVFLACCYGGAVEMAAEVFAQCREVERVVGAEGRVTPDEIALAFHFYLFLTIVRKQSPEKAAKTCSAVVGVRICVKDVFSQGNV